MPRGATVLHNPNGTAPGLYLAATWEGRTIHLFLLPGPPRELRPMVRDQVLPILDTPGRLGAAQEPTAQRPAGVPVAHGRAKVTVRS